MPAPLVTLGVRSAACNPDAADYAAYEVARDRFLLSPHGRAALLKGGIVWRLAMEFLSPGIVLAGPSDIASASGYIMHLLGIGDFCDDDLSEDELDLICGVYRVYTGNAVLIPDDVNSLNCCIEGSGDQVSHLSWWPKHSTWVKSLFNVGYWTPLAEDWFQKRLAEIRSNQTQCKTAGMKLYQGVESLSY
jgi:hypothetical protein